MQANSKKTLIQLMNERGFELTNVNNEEKAFIFLYKGINKKFDKIICEIHKESKFKFIYTHEEMVGYLDSGLVEEYRNEIVFTTVLQLFSETVNVLKSYYGGCNE